MEGLYWFNGAMNYLPYFSLAVLNAGLAFALCFADKLPTRRKFFMRQRAVCAVLSSAAGISGRAAERAGPAVGRGALRCAPP